MKLPTKRVDDWLSLARIESTVLEHARENGWVEPEADVTVHDAGGSYEVGSVSQAQMAARNSRHKVTGVRLYIGEKAEPRRSVSADTLQLFNRAWVRGPKEAEVIGLAGLLDEILRAQTAPPTGEPRRPLGRRDRLRRWWRSQHLGTQLLVSIAGSLIASGLIAALVALVT